MIDPTVSGPIIPHGVNPITYDSMTYDHSDALYVPDWGTQSVPLAPKPFIPLPMDTGLGGRGGHDMNTRPPKYIINENGDIVGVFPHSDKRPRHDDD